MTNRQLDIYKTIISDEMARLNKLLNEQDFENFRYYRIDGIISGLCSALTWLEVIEEGKRFKSKIQEIEERLDKEEKS